MSLKSKKREKREKVRQELEAKRREYGENLETKRKVTGTQAGTQVDMETFERVVAKQKAEIDEHTGSNACVFQRERK